MVNSLLLGETLYKLLSSDPILREYVDGKIYPLLVKDEDVKFPFVVFFRNTLTSTMNKMGIYQDTVSFSVVVVSNTYNESIHIANEVRRILEFKKYTTDEMVMCNVHLTAMDEGFLADNFVQTLTFSCDIQ